MMDVLTLFAVTLVSWLGLFIGFFILRSVPEEYEPLKRILAIASWIVVFLLGLLVVMTLYRYEFYRELVLVILIGVFLAVRGTTLLDIYLLFGTAILLTRYDEKLTFIVSSLVFLFGLFWGGQSSNIQKKKVFSTLGSLVLQSVWYVVLVPILIVI